MSIFLSVGVATSMECYLYLTQALAAGTLTSCYVSGRKTYPFPSVPFDLEGEAKIRLTGQLCDLLSQTW